MGFMSSHSSVGNKRNRYFDLCKNSFRFLNTIFRFLPCWSYYCSKIYIAEIRQSLLDFYGFHSKDSALNR